MLVLRHNFQLNLIYFKLLLRSVGKIQLLAHIIQTKQHFTSKGLFWALNSGSFKFLLVNLDHLARPHFFFPQSSNKIFYSTCRKKVSQKYFIMYWQKTQFVFPSLCFCDLFQQLQFTACFLYLFMVQGWTRLLINSFFYKLI